METLHYLLMKTHAMLQRNIITQAAKIGLSSGQPKVLDYLLKYGENDQKTIAAYCEIEQATVGSILTRMENAGLVERKQKEGNRRSLFVCLTEKGKKAAEDMSAIFERADKQAVCALSEENLEQLKSFLYIICDSLAHESEA